MVTKWKSSVKQAVKLLRKEIRLVLGIVFLILGANFFYTVVVYRNHHPTEEAVFFGIVGNFFFGAGLAFVLVRIWNKKYGAWRPEDESFYQEWKQKGMRLETGLLTGGGIALLASFCYFTYLLKNPWNGTGGWYGNYASGYLMILTVFIQFLVCQMLLLHFMSGKLNLLMGQMELINKRNLENALEIERSSLEKVSRSDQLRVDLITNVSHDLKTPLTSIVGYLELLRKEELGAVAADYVEVILERAQKLKEMIESLFSLAKASSGNVELHMEQFEINRLIEQILADMKDRIEQSGLQFVTRFTEESTQLVSDNMYFYRICQNLLENALKYSAKGTRVFIKTCRKDEMLLLEITNTAGYFMDFKKDDITERFVRGDQARSTEGNGLGLAIVSTYAKVLGGEFDIQVDCDQFKAVLKFSVSK